MAFRGRRHHLEAFDHTLVWYAALVDAKLVVIAGPDRGTVFELDGSGATIGRGDTARAKLADTTVSRVHCEVVREGEALVIVHAGGTNPTLVNGAAVERAVLSIGDQIEVGRSTLRVVGRDDDAEVIAVRAAASPTVAIDTFELARRSGDDVAALAKLGDALHRATERDAVAAQAAAVLSGVLDARHVAIVMRDAADRLVRLGEERALVVVGEAQIADAVGHGRATATNHGDRTVLVAPLAPADGAFGIAGALIAERAATQPPWQRHDVELASAAARLIGASLGALAALERSTRAQRALGERRATGAFVVGRSPEMQKLAQLIGKVASAGTTVLVHGESGTGKEWVAEAIHARSPRVRAPLVSVNCAALTETLLESELFGHEKGAFTGANERRVGRFEQADGGTLFLDEVGELSLAAQGKLLRVLETRRFERIGGTKTLAVDVRLIAATNRDLQAMVRGGKFREDLYYRLAVVTLIVPPLRERPSDVLPLAEHFQAHFAAACGRRIDGFTPAAIQALEGHWWPGNVRELRNVIERAVVLGDGARIDVEDLALEGASGTAEDGDQQARTLEDMEKQAVVRALETTRGNKAAAAQLLGIDRTTLYKKLRRFSLR